MKKLTLIEQVVDVFASGFHMDVSATDPAVIELRFDSPRQAKEWMHSYDKCRTDFVARATAPRTEPT